MAGTCPFFLPSQDVFFASHAPVQHVWAAHGGGICLLFSPSQDVFFACRMPVQQVCMGLIGCVEAVFGRMRAEGPTCFSARGIAGYGVCFRVSDLQGQQKHKVCVSFALSERED